MLLLTGRTTYYNFDSPEDFLVSALQGDFKEEGVKYAEQAIKRVIQYTKAGGNFLPPFGSDALLEEEDLKLIQAMKTERKKKYKLIKEFKEKYAGKGSLAGDAVLWALKMLSNRIFSVSIFDDGVEIEEYKAVTIDTASSRFTINHGYEHAYFS